MRSKWSMPPHRFREVLIYLKMVACIWRVKELDVYIVMLLGEEEDI